jgi:N-acyl-L-homoserine lactone synthetase
MNLFLAQERNDYDAIFALRYRAYRSIGAIDENPRRTFTDLFDNKLNSFSFGLEADGRVIGAIRIMVSECGGRDLTANLAFPDAIERSFDSTQRVIEANRFVVDPAFKSATADLEHQFVLFRALVIVALIVDADHYICAARKNHIPFYQRVVFMRPLADERQYPGLSVAMRLLGGDFRVNYHRVCLRWGGQLRVAACELADWKARMTRRD